MSQLFYSGQYWAPKILCKCYSGVFGNTFVGTKYLSSYRCVTDNPIRAASFGNDSYAARQLEWHASSYSVYWNGKRSQMSSLNSTVT